MQNATLEDGVTPLFHYKDFLEDDQIKATFSSTYGKEKRGKASKNSLLNVGQEEIDDTTGFEDEDEEYDHILNKEIGKKFLKETVMEELNKEPQRRNTRSKNKGGKSIRSSSLDPQSEVRKHNTLNFIVCCVNFFPSLG